MQNNQQTKITHRFIYTIILVVIAFAGGLLLGTSGLLTNKVFNTITNNTSAFDTSYLMSIYSKMQQDYLGDTPTGEEITQSMAEGLIESLNDPYSAYLNPADAKEYLKMADSAYDGIGVHLGYNEQYPTVVSAIEGFPGYKAGLLPGDIIISVDGQDMAKVRPEIAATKIKGLAGTSVKLEVFRESEGRVIEFVIVRAEVKLENITYTELDNGIIRINIARFTEGAQGILSGAEVFMNKWDEIVSEVVAKNPSGIILDLRNNPGGYVDAVRHVAEEFLSGGDIVMREEEKNKEEIIYYDNRTGKLESIPLVIVVNEGSASASEIMAGAVQGNDRGEVIGQKTVGKGVEQELLPLDDGALLLLVFRKWLTPTGLQISAESPITPDQIVEYTAGANGGLDSQLQKAFDLLTQ
jgi:carboxyl-terminal processing protease